MKPSELDTGRWKRIDRLFDAALDLPSTERARFLREECAGDDELRREVEALLEAHHRSHARYERSVSPLSAGVPSDTQTVEGREVGPFRLIREIGRGGMGVVYEAEDTRLGRHVALKALPPYLGLGDEAKRRFLSEARAVSALDHPNIATLFEIDATEHGQLYMAFALYEGETLARRIARGPIEPDEAVRIASAIASGLGAAHERGIVHRDVKPSNVLLTDKGEVKLLDFGVAKVAGENVTGEGERLGTVAYMSPEQAGGGVVDERADLWSLGVLVYEMLAGERPFRGHDQHSLIHSIVHEEPAAIPAADPDTPKAGLTVVLGRLLAKDPDHRYPSAAHLLHDLAALGPGSPSSPPAVVATPHAKLRGAGPQRLSHGRPSRPGRRAGVALAGVGAIAIAGFSWMVSRSPPAANDVRRVAVMPLVNLMGSDDRDYVVQGVHEALIGELSRIGALDVTSRTSVMRYAGAQLSVPQIAEELGVDAIVEGAVGRVGSPVGQIEDSLTITAQLVAVSPEERTLWAERHETAIGGIPGVTADIAGAIATASGLRLSPDERARLAAPQEVNPDAYDSYLRGKINLDRRSREAHELARNHFSRALEIDSTFVPAYQGLAATYGSAAIFGMEPPHEGFPIARELAQRALAIDSTHADAHYTLAAVAFWYDWDLRAAERHALRALDLNPSDAAALRLLAQVSIATGRPEQAARVIARAGELDRLSAASEYQAVVLRYLTGKYGAAIERAREGVEFHTGFWPLHWLLCVALVDDGSAEDAIPECEEAVALSGGNPLSMSGLGYAYALSGRTGDAEAIALDLLERSASVYVGDGRIAVIYAALGDLDRAFALMESAYDARESLLAHLANLGYYEPLRSDPRYDALIERIGG